LVSNVAENGNVIDFIHGCLAEAVMSWDTQN